MGSRSPNALPVPVGIAPWLCVADATGAVAFYAEAFGAVAVERLEAEPGVVMVAQLAVGGALFWVQHDAGASPRAAGGVPPVRMILTVPDPDAAFARAVAAGACVVFPVAEDHGWRIGRVVDPSGHHWEIGTPLLA